MMQKAGIKEPIFLCLVPLGFFAHIVSLRALTIAEDQTTQRRRQKPPMLGIDTGSVRSSFFPSAHHRFETSDAPILLRGCRIDLSGAVRSPRVFALDLVTLEIGIALLW